MSEEAHAHEIVIIKRHGGGHEDAHHGGVWKIAFADFMTAMMAFFLVMWLISASDKTKAVIAKYFNPVELVDSTQQPPGLNNTKKSDPSLPRKSDKVGSEPQGEPAKPEGQSQAPILAAAKPSDDTKSPAEAKNSADVRPLATSTDKATIHDEAELFRDPYAVLADIAAKNNAKPVKETKPSPLEGTQVGAGAVGLKGGEAFRDPFVPAQLATARQPKGILPGSPVASATDGPSAADQRVEAKGATPSSAALPTQPTPAQASIDAANTANVSNATNAQAEDKLASAAGLRAKIEALTKEANADGANNQPKIEVRRTDEGTLISLTDSAGFSMFSTASAMPAPKMVALMEQIGRLLKGQKGAVTVRGFTDSRPFKSVNYDNWRLSSARAHMAQYMLVRGGLDDQRIDKVEGYADRRPKNPKDPEGPENRRIEILLRDPTP